MPIKYGARDAVRQGTINRRSSTPRARNSSNRSVVNSSSSAALSIPHSCALSAPSLHNPPNQLSKHSSRPNSSWTTSPPKTKQCSPTTPVTWCSPSTATPVISANPRHAAEQEDISFSHPMQKSHTTTEPSSTLPTSSNMSWPLPPKQNWRHSTSWPARQSSSVLSWKNLATHNLPPRSKQTTPPRKASSMERSNPNGPKPWTCDSIGSEIVNAKNSSASTGAQENSITRTIGLNITLPPITNTYGRSLSHHNSSWQCYDLANAPNQLHQLPSST
eukprot:CCRYP_020572-RC/>CCRYP_020572-RC protein AED:0.41 eAED:0.48 QI:0/-1/0/1/-1/1/1/0/274